MNSNAYIRTQFFRSKQLKLRAQYQLD